ncbi:hypothetical protein QBD01_003127 [Ochrobactrum sp. 19YEA23]|uniref:hypothetical protein n=1 Tax=Ochrobactrum sp. 19YEA23 TaxID=3039854 RepID=UPI00247A4521|nr:hypothetical protein [Ochrobactrum sp. 19YEA23]
MSDVPPLPALTSAAPFKGAVDRAKIEPAALLLQAFPVRGQVALLEMRRSEHAAAG